MRYFEYGDKEIQYLTDFAGKILNREFHHRKEDRKLFEKYRKRFSPYCSVASLYLWAVAGGAIPEMKDYAVKKASVKEKNKKVKKEKDKK